MIFILYYKKMGQAEIINLLKKENKWLSSKQITKKLKVSICNYQLNALLKYGEILKKEVKINCHWEYQYKIK